MNIKTFNVALLLGWLLILVGGMVINVGGGLAVGGLVLILLVFAEIRIAGLYAPGDPKLKEPE